MSDTPIIQCRLVSPEDLLQIQTLLAEHPAWHRTRISRTLCDLWSWRNEAGQLKDMACRTLLLKPLHRNSRSRLTMS